MADIFDDAFYARADTHIALSNEQADSAPTTITCTRPNDIVVPPASSSFAGQASAVPEKATRKTLCPARLFPWPPRHSRQIDAFRPRPSHET